MGGFADIDTSEVKNANRLSHSLRKFITSVPMVKRFSTDLFNWLLTRRVRCAKSYFVRPKLGER